jgi:hypothetical protein
MKSHLATRWRAIAAVALGIAGALAGCNIVVDAGSYHVGQFSSSGDDAEVDSGDDALEGTESGAVADVGTPGQGEGGSAAEGGTASEGGEAGTVGVCGSAPLPTTAAFQQLVNACVIASSCDPDLFTTNISGCVTDNYLQAYGSLGCLSSITSCADYYSCEGTSAATPSQCTDTGSETDVGTCSASGVATSCYYSSDNFNTVSNCPMLGGTCTVYDTDTDGDQAAGCLLGTCTETDAPTLHCMGTTKIYECIDGKAYGQLCPSASICGTPSGGVSSCYYQSSACTTPGSSCASGVLTTCNTVQVPSGADQTVDYNCGTSGLQCEADDAGSGQCVSPGCEQSTTCTESCDGTSIITFCVGGVADTYDCTTSGFTTCGSQTSGSLTYAYCLY